MFTLYLPQTVPSRRAGRGCIAEKIPVPAPVEALSPEDPAELQFVNEAGDDRDDIQPGDLVILIVENDLGFARSCWKRHATRASRGWWRRAAPALAMVREYQPAVMTLDIFLPDMQGWRVLERLKADLSTRHPGVRGVDRRGARSRARLEAIGFISKPLVSRDLVDRAIEP